MFWAPLAMTLGDSPSLPPPPEVARICSMPGGNEGVFLLVFGQDRSSRRRSDIPISSPIACESCKAWLLALRLSACETHFQHPGTSPVHETGVQSFSEAPDGEVMVIALAAACDASKIVFLYVSLTPFLFPPRRSRVQS